jgi:hypothetical protein
MGVHDYTCSLCGTPASYTCNEARFEPCEQEGIGEDQAHLALFFFREAEAPTTPEEFEEARGRALRVEERAFGYDWGDWEFQPSLNYRGVLMDSEDDAGVWAISTEAGLDEGTVELEVPAGEKVWVVNYCPVCRDTFLAPTPPAPDGLCTLYVSAIAEQLGLRWGPDMTKVALLEQARARAARRRPIAT